MQSDLEQRLQDFAQQARALADLVHQEGGRSSAVTPGGFQGRVNVLSGAPEHPLVEQLRDTATAVDLYRQEQRACGGSGLDDDAKCEFCDGRAELPQETTQERRPDAWVGMGWYNALTRLERAQWHQRAGSAVPADAWRAYQREAHP